MLHHIISSMAGPSIHLSGYPSRAHPFYPTTREGLLPHSHVIHNSPCRTTIQNGWPKINHGNNSFMIILIILQQSHVMIWFFITWQGHCNLFLSVVPGHIVVSSTICHTKYTHSFVVLCFVVVCSSVLCGFMLLIYHILQGCFTGTGAITWLPQC